ncbi:MAG: hypothetical protein U5K38_03025 [Woeseiaceae bacterium]|nr:hypothetical protein [Woeseiaceae bacterium]
MRTTLDIDNDVLQAAKERARREHRTLGQVLSALARRGLTAPDAPSAVAEPKAVYGFKPLPRRGSLVTNELIDKLREDDAY